MAAPSPKSCKGETVVNKTENKSSEPESGQNNREYLNPSGNDPLLEMLNVVERGSGENSRTSRQTYRIPQSSLLSKVKSFLPVIDVANKKLEEDIIENSADAYDIEHIDSNTDKVIEMDISLVPMNDLDAVQSNGGDHLNQSGNSDTDSSDSRTDDDSSSSDESPEITEKNFKITKKNNKGKAKIVEVG